jgi:hypothetical protein
VKIEMVASNYRRINGTLKIIWQETLNHQCKFRVYIWYWISNLELSFWTFVHMLCCKRTHIDVINGHLNGKRASKANCMDIYFDVLFTFVKMKMPWKPIWTLSTHI